MPRPYPRRSTAILNLIRKQMKLMVSLMTAHGNFKAHLHKMGITKEPPECRMCGEEDETAGHLIFQCEALETKRYNIFGTIDPKEIISNNKLVEGFLTMFISIN
ncbi:hypothetical protein C0J52_16846 [Blattella germanica]|nr:hypothetical protein C0J52_16846 [Blattella germanica]